MAITDRPWDGSASRWPDAASYCRSCLIVRAHEGDLSKGDCSLPIREPNGDINKNAVHAAASSLAGGRGGVKAPPELKKAAARKLKAMYAQMKEDLPESIKNML